MKDEGKKVKLTVDEQIAKLFLRYHPNAKDDIRRKAHKYSFCSDLAEKHLNENREPENWHYGILLN